MKDTIVVSIPETTETVPDTEKALRASLANLTLPDLKAYCDRHGLKVKNKDKLGHEQLVNKIVTLMRTRNEVGI